SDPRRRLGEVHRTGGDAGHGTVAFHTVRRPRERACPAHVPTTTTEVPVLHAESRSTASQDAGAARPGRRRVLASLGTLPAGAVLASAGAAVAAPGEKGKGAGKGHGNGKGHGRHGDLRLGVENLLEPEALETLRDARVGLITNPTGTDRELRSTIDLLVEAQDAGGFTMTALYGPEHGVRGAEPAGGSVGDYIDEKTGLPVRSLYGETQKPTPEMLADVDLLVFDIQDIGTRLHLHLDHVLRDGGRRRERQAVPGAGPPQPAGIRHRGLRARAGAVELRGPA